MPRIEDHPHYPLLKALKARDGPSLMARYGAHALGIGWRRDAGGRVPALVFYLEAPPQASGYPAVPASLAFDPGDGSGPVTLACETVIGPQASDERGGG